MKRKALAAVVLLLALIPSARLAWTARDMPQLGSIWDDGLYWVCAKSLAQGSGYRILNLPGQPHQTKYPPLYPLLLSQIWKINPRFPENLVLATFFSWLIFLPFLLTAIRLCRELGLSWVQSLSLCIFLALNPAVVLFSLNLMTELLFACLLLAALGLAERAARLGSGNWQAPAAGTLAGLAYLTRSAAVPMLVTVPLCFLLRKRYSRALLFLAAMLPAVAGWNWWVRSQLPSSSDVVTLYYTNYLGYHLHNVSWANLPLVVWRNTAGLLSGIGGLIMSNVPGSPLVKIASWVLAILAIVGSVRLMRRASATQHLLFTVSFLVLLVLWHFPPDERYVLPVFPLLLAGLFVELGRIVRMVRSSLQTKQIAPAIAAVAISLLLVALASSAVYLNTSTLARYLPSFIDRERSYLVTHRKAYVWIAANLPKDAALLAHYDSVLYLYTGRPAMRLVVPSVLSYSRDQQPLIAYLHSLGNFARRHGLSYVFLGPGDFYSAELPRDGVSLLKDVVNRSSEFRLLYESSAAAIYRVLPPPQPTA